TKEKLIEEDKNYNSAKQKFNRGVISKNELLESRLKLLTLENEAINAKTERIVNYFTLYKAVGGKL
ncbi:MAG: TolC family protein, partial [Candidatus Gastranaerophilales bacterium]|nr:TolC family protein [Candidatus Gastranaerophilales bacterium]